MSKAPAHLGQIFLDAASIFKPPERLTVSQAAAKYRKLHNPPKYSGPYKNDETPYMVEPQDMTMSREHTSVVFVGPSQSGKTEAVILNTCAYIVKCNPMDAIIFGPSQTAARDFSKRRIDRMHRHSKDLSVELLSGQHADNTHDKTYRSGMMLSISWPSSNEMSSKPVPVTMLTEYDRMPDDVDGEGSPFLLAQKRTTIFGSMAMTVVDSSPSRDVEDTKWKASTLHEAPPCNGILGLYNQGDRRRWYWPCPHCGEFFEGHFGLLRYETVAVVDDVKVTLSPKKSADSVYMECPRSGCKIAPTEKHGMNLRGVWLTDGERITKDGVRYGEPTVSSSATYWLRGTAATYVSWKDLVVKFINAEKKFLETNTQEDLKTTVNTDQGDPYFPRGNETNRLAEDLMDHALPLPKKMVPHDVRALFAMVDVQKNRWEVQVMGVRPVYPAGYDIVVIDRFPIVKSNRLDQDDERLWVKPASHLEDWDLLISDVMDKKYPLADGSGEMAIRMTFCDSGGKEGVTSMIYDFYRKLKKEGLANRFMPVKGENHAGSPRAAVSYPDTKRKDRLAQARGEIPVLFFNANSLKDTLNNMLDREQAGGGKIDFPDWLELPFFEELTVETKTAKGWENKAGRRNEAWDLCAYFIGACVWQKVDTVDWENPPSWLKPWKHNPLVTVTDLAQKDGVDKGASKPQSFADLAANLA